MILSLKNLAALRRAVALILLGLFMAALLGQGLGLLLLPLLGPSQAGMVLAAYVAGGAGTLVLGILAAHLVMALIFGRVFCSWLCPLGIVQDISARFFARLAGANSVNSVPGGKSKKQHYHFARSGAARYILPALLISALFWPFIPQEGQGASGVWLYGLAEPYSIFARSVQSIGQPVQALFVNALAVMGEESGLFLLPRIPYKIDLTGLALAVPILGLVLALVPRGRGYCNSICPVGALLGLIGASAWLRPRFTKDCNSCGLCERRCKARCLNPTDKTLDGSRCVTCYNCLESCPRGGLALTPQPVPYMPERAFLLRALPVGAWAVLLAPLTRTLIQQSLPPLADATLPTSTVARPRSRLRFSMWLQRGTACRCCRRGPCRSHTWKAAVPAAIPALTSARLECSRPVAPRPGSNAASPVWLCRAWIFPELFARSAATAVQRFAPPERCDQ